MTVRGGGVPLTPHGSNAGKKNGSAASELAADAYPCIMVWVFGPPHTSMWHEASCTDAQLPSDLSSPTRSSVPACSKPPKDEPFGWRYAHILDCFCARRLSLDRGSGRGNGLPKSSKETEG